MKPCPVVRRKSKAEAGAHAPIPGIRWRKTHSSPPAAGDY